MYLVWKRQDCFFKALAARYCAFVPCSHTVSKLDKRTSGPHLHKVEDEKEGLGGQAVKEVQ